MSIDIRELRIGNIVSRELANDTLIPAGVEGIEDTDNGAFVFVYDSIYEHVVWVSPDQVFGIELTPKVLKEWGFNNKESAPDSVAFERVINEQEWVVAVVFYNNKINVGIYHPSLHFGCGLNVQYLHQFQNLIFALTGEELKKGAA